MNKKKSPKRERPNFQDILGDVATLNARRLMARARLANRLAKSLRGQNRWSAYTLKSRALFELVARFPERVRIVNDTRTPRFVVVKVPRDRFGLHAPAGLFNSEHN